MSIHFKIGAVRTMIEGHPEAVKEVRDFLAVPTPGAQHTPQFKMGRWDGMTRFLTPAGKSFPTGLLPRVVGFLKDKGIHFDAEYINPPDRARGAPQFAPDSLRGCLSGVTLRDYQVRAVVAALRAGRMAIQCPTGAGKTEIGAAIIKILKKPTLWMVHRKELLNQTAERLETRLGFKGVGRIGGGEVVPRFLTVGMVQTLNNLLGEHGFPWEHFQVLVIDEVHHLSADTWFTISEKCTNAFHRFGLSGTIITGNLVKDYKLEGATGPVFTVAGTMGLAREGYLAKPRIRMVKVNPGSYPSYEEVREAVLPEWRKDPRRLSKLGGKLFREAYERGILHNSARNVAISKIVSRHLANKEKVLVLCTRINHGHLLTKLTSQHDPWWLHGEEDAEYRRAALEAYKEQEGGRLLIASNIFDEGIDIPQIDTLILAGGGESYIKSIQRVGRALRPRADKEEVLIYDFLDGRDASHKKDYLARHAAQRLSDYREQGFDVEMEVAR